MIIDSTERNNVQMALMVGRSSSYVFLINKKKSAEVNKQFLYNTYPNLDFVRFMRPISKKLQSTTS